MLAKRQLARPEKLERAILFGYFQATINDFEDAVYLRPL
jgi:hypothetical protein